MKDPEYWQLVEECLVAFHRCTPKQAKKDVEDFIKKLEETPEEVEHYIYSEEQYHMACVVANVAHSYVFPEHQAKYKELQDKIYGLPPVNGE